MEKIVGVVIFRVWSESDNVEFENVVIKASESLVGNILVITTGEQRNG
jgi:hypothetical protein